MGNTLTSPKGGPLFTNTPTQTATDLNAARIFTEKMGNHRIGTTAERTAAAGSDVFEGLYWEDTTDGNTYKYVSSSWVVWATPLATGTVVAGANFAVNGPFTELVRKNGFVTLGWYISKTAGGNIANGDILGTLPVGFRPVKRKYGGCLVYSGVTPANSGIIIETTGIMTAVVTYATGTDHVGTIPPFLAA